MTSTHVADPAQADRLAPGRALAFAAIFAVAILPVLTTPIIPLIDFYNHLARFFVLATLDHTPFLQKSYASGWAIMPNIGLDLIGAELLRWIDPMRAGHIIVVAMMANIYASVLVFNRRLTGCWSLLTAILLVPLLYSFIFIWGFANFLFGLGLCFWGASWWLAWRGRPWIGVPVACVIAVAVFLSHGLAFVLYGLLLGSLELGFFLTARERRLSSLAAYGVALAVQAVAPAILFLVSATAAATASSGVTGADEAIRKLVHTGGLADRLVQIIIYRLQTIFRVAEGPSLWFDVASLIVTVALLAALARRGRLRLHPVAWPALALAAVLVIFLPPGVLGVAYAADRMPLFFALIFVGAVVFRPRGDRFEKACVGALLALVILRIVALGVQWQEYRRDFAQFRTVAAAIPSSQTVQFVYISRLTRVEPGPRCEMYGPLLALLYGQATPLFADNTQQPLKIIGDLRQGIDALPANPHLQGIGEARYERDVVAASAKAGRFGYVLVCNADRLPGPLPANVSVAAQSGRFQVLRIQ
jgi:hypothetical protein